MPFAAGTFSLFATGNPVVTGTSISSTWANSTLSDIATGLSTCVLKDGTQTVTANIPMANFKFTGLGAGSSVGDSATIGRTETLSNKTLASPVFSGTATGAIFTNPGGTTQALTDASTISWDASLGANATVTLTASRTMAAPTNIKAGGFYTLHVSQNGTGGWALTWNSVFKGHGGQAIASVQPIPTASSTSAFLFVSPDGTNLNLIWSRIGAIQTFSGSGTYTPTSGMRWCRVTGVAGGGGSGGAASTGAAQGSASGGGGPGGWAVRILSAGQIGTSQVVTIGTGGIAGTNAPGTGGTGVSTSLGALLVATGGIGSIAGTITGGTQPDGSPGASGIGTTGDLLFNGATGTYGMVGGAANSIGGVGGSTPFGAGGIPIKTTSGAVGVVGTGFGSGPSGSANGPSQGTLAGQAGQPGFMFIEEFF